MTQDALIAQAKSRFSDVFGAGPARAAYAPGRVNLLGEHTDYNGGLVLPMPLTLGTAVAVGFGGEAGVVQISSTSFDAVETRKMTDMRQDHWTDYVIGSLIHLLPNDPLKDGLQVMVTTNLPIGSGLSSSAAVEVATMRATAPLFDKELSDVALAQLARKAENEFVGVPCGIMDQYSVSVGDPGTAVYLNTRTLASEIAPLPDSHHFVIVHSGVSHKLSEDGYETRVAECHAACAALGVALLSDLSMQDISRCDELDGVIGKRARHIVTENDRVERAVAALKARELDLFARLMVESHISQRDDYAVSVPEVDALVQGALDAGADGARLTGGGFGGSIVAFVEKSRVAECCRTIDETFPNADVLAIT